VSNLIERVMRVGERCFVTTKDVQFGPKSIKVQCSRGILFDVGIPGLNFGKED